MQEYNQILEVIKFYDEIVIARHTGPDPDAIASQIGLRDIIKLNFPEKKVYAVGASVSRFKFIGSLDKLNEDTLTNPLLIVTDIPELPRVDGVDITKYAYTIKMDHHPCDKKICNIDCVDEKATSACEIIADFAYSCNLQLSPSITKTLFTGIISDSERFLLSYTTPKTFMICSRLLNDYPFDFDIVYSNLYERPINEKKFQAYLLENLNISENGFAGINITEEILKKYEVDAGTPSNMVNDFNFIKGLKVWAFSSFDEKTKCYKINIRSRNVVINDIASQFNGGGHKFASGARLTTLDEVEKLFKALDERCKESNEE